MLADVTAAATAASVQTRQRDVERCDHPQPAHLFDAYEHASSQFFCSEPQCYLLRHQLWALYSLAPSIIRPSAQAELRAQAMPLVNAYPRASVLPLHRLTGVVPIVICANKKDLLGASKRRVQAKYDRRGRVAGTARIARCASSSLQLARAFHCVTCLPSPFFMCGCFFHCANALCTLQQGRLRLTFKHVPSPRKTRLVLQAKLS